jgi:hypothetical protein
MGKKCIKITMPGSVNLGSTREAIADVEQQFRSSAEGTLKFSFKCDGAAEAIKQLAEMAMEAFYASVELSVNKIVRNYVEPPVRGEITRGKLRWRGLALIFAKDDHGNDVFLGVYQRGNIIREDGSRVPFDLKNRLPKFDL